jgi:hypothetical protein
MCILKLPLDLRLIIINFNSMVILKVKSTLGIKQYYIGLLMDKEVINKITLSKLNMV